MDGPVTLGQLVSGFLQLIVVFFVLALWGALALAFLRDWSIGKPENHISRRILRFIDRLSGRGAVRT